MKFSGFLFLLIGLAAVAPWIPSASRSHGPTGEGERVSIFPGWSHAPLPDGVWSVPLASRDERFARQFPGKLATFTDGSRTWIVRWVNQPTRALHPASDCLRAAGYAVKPTSAWADLDGAIWSVCVATRGQERLRIREHVFNPSGEGWSDVSAWYWHALLGRTAGPWWAVTALEPETSEAGPSEGAQR